MFCFRFRTGTAQETAPADKKRRLPDRQVALHDILLDTQIADNEALPFVGILAHVELQHIVDRVVLRKPHLIQADILADEPPELVGRNLAQTFESGDFGVGAASCDRPIFSSSL